MIWSAQHERHSNVVIFSLLYGRNAIQQYWIGVWSLKTEVAQQPSLAKKYACHSFRMIDGAHFVNHSLVATPTYVPQKCMKNEMLTALLVIH